MEAIFQTQDKYGHTIYDDEGLLFKFQRQNLNLIRSSSGILTRTSESDSWVAVVDDENLIKRAKKHPKYGKEFKIIDELPKALHETIVKKFTQDQSVLKTKAKRLGQLEAQLLNKDGTFKRNADLSLLDELEQLRKEIE